MSVGREPWTSASASRKGIVLDDTTHQWCADKLHFHWPNTDEPVKSIRMFKAWSEFWTEQWTPEKEVAWGQISSYLNAADATALVGTQITCNETQDDADWENVLHMISVFGAHRIMGIAVGNELELMWTKELPDKDECLDRLWNQEYFLNKFHSRVNDLNKLGNGFENVKVTSVFGGFILADAPFYENPGHSAWMKLGVAKIETFLKNVTTSFGPRYAHTLNIYPYFDDNQHFDSNGKTCNRALTSSLCMDTPDPKDCVLTANIDYMRENLEKLTGTDDNLLWIGETGWSYPKAHTLTRGEMQWCPDWSTSKSFTQYYSNFLNWDLSMNGTRRGPDHVFYFAMRDSLNFGFPEGFGLVGDGEPSTFCSNTSCKIQSAVSDLFPTSLTV